MKNKSHIVFALTICLVSLIACNETYQTTPYNWQNPQLMIQPEFPSFNPMTVEGVNLGRKLFYDPILSKNNMQSCASCHTQEYGFTDDGLQFSTGVDGIQGDRNSMPTFNLAWEKRFFWDGRSATLEDQILHPVINPIEMNISWGEVITKLNTHATYPELFKQAFNIDEIDSTHVSYAIAQFLRSIVSANSKFDKYLRGEVELTLNELNGLTIYNTERGDCFHCHEGAGSGLYTDRTFKNNGLDVEADLEIGYMAVTGQVSDKGKFKVPTLRNIELTAPYMHDGRFATLEEVVDHYDSGGNNSSTIDPLMKHVGTGLNLTAQEKSDLVAFLKCLTDYSLISNTNYSNPN